MGYEALGLIARSLPTTIETVKENLGLKDDDFLKFAVCPKCYSLYTLSDVTSGGTPRCTFVQWPRHTQAQRRTKCNGLLLKNGNPKRIFAYRPIQNYLKYLVKKPKFLAMCNQWRNELNDNEYYSDIYDGNLWKTKHKSYLMKPYNLLGMINVDWFQPYKHSPYSLGAIYMVTLNLPRRERFKEENIMLLGVIPGPTEPSLHMNTYLTPIVKELKQLNRGVRLCDGSALGNIYRYRLFGFSCDLPACRKIGGMVSFSAKLG